MQVHDLARMSEPKDRTILARDASASVRGLLTSKLDRLEIAKLEVVTPYGRLDGAGPVHDLAGHPRFDLRGSLAPDWKALTDLLAERVEPGASISGSPRGWRLAGTLPEAGAKDPLAGLNGELGVNLQQVDVFGMRLSRSALVVKLVDGKTRIDPIDGTLNSGRLHLEPEVMTDTQGQTWLHLGTASGLLDAVVNDEVSHRVLLYVAPVLDQATRVRGRVSVALNDAYFPMGGALKAEPRIDGDVLFDAVEFMPGPLAEQLLSVFKLEERPLLVLRDPVSVRMVGRRIYQEGLVIPVAKVAAIGMEGWVDFDQNLDMVARFAMVPPRRNIPVLSDLLENAQFQLPITGTLKKPRIDTEALKDRFKDFGVNLLDNAIGAGVNALGRIMQGGARRDGQRGDFFPPFQAPGAGQSARPPEPQAPGAAPAGGARDSSTRKPQADPVDPDDDAAPAQSRPGQLSPEERRAQREERRARRLDKRAERRLRRGLPPE